MVINLSTMEVLLLIDGLVVLLGSDQASASNLPTRSVGRSRALRPRDRLTLSIGGDQEAAV
jgi:hypothetical protein